MEVTLQNIVDKVYENALLFNKIVDGGKGFDELDKETLLSKIRNQYIIAREEVDETLKAIEENDIIEIYDGIVDSFYTVPVFVEMLDLHYEKYCQNSSISDEDSIKYDRLILDYDNKIDMEYVNIEVLNKAADMIIENNMSKFTTSEEEFNTWTSPYNRKSLDVDGVKYYFFVDDNGKVKKRDNFPSVDLSVLF
jgi:hypothetical protein